MQDLPLFTLCLPLTEGGGAVPGGPGRPRHCWWLPRAGLGPRLRPRKPCRRVRPRQKLRPRPVSGALGAARPHELLDHVGRWLGVRWLRAGGPPNWTVIFRDDGRRLGLGQVARPIACGRARQFLRGILSVTVGVGLPAVAPGALVLGFGLFSYGNCFLPFAGGLLRWAPASRLRARAGSMLCTEDWGGARHLRHSGLVGRGLLVPSPLVALAGRGLRWSFASALLMCPLYVLTSPTPRRGCPMGLACLRFRKPGAPGPPSALSEASFGLGGCGHNGGRRCGWPPGRILTLLEPSAALRQFRVGCRPLQCSHGRRLCLRPGTPGGSCIW